MIIAIASTKGGVGKSTLAMHFAHALQLRYPDDAILLLDADPQATSVRWARRRAERELSPFIDVQPLLDEGMRQILAQRKMQYRHILIDVGGTDNPNLRRALIHVDAVVVPSSLEPAERQHTFDMMQLLSEARSEFNPNLMSFMILNKVKATSERNFLPQFKAGFPAFIHWIEGFIMHRVAFSRVYSQGKTTFDLLDKEQDAKANAEIEGALDQILPTLKEPS